MYLWNTEALAVKLKDGELSQKERFKYFFIFIVLTALLMEVCLYVGEIPSVITITEAAITLIITIGGTLLSYKKNRDGDNKEFIDRYVCLSIPILIKLTVLFVGCYIAYMIVGYMFLNETFDKDIDSTTWIDVLFTLLSELLFYWRLIHHFSWVSKTKAS
jgi:hypothetical protein